MRPSLLQGVWDTLIHQVPQRILGMQANAKAAALLWLHTEAVSEPLLAFYIPRAGVRLQAHRSLAVGLNTSGVPNGPSGIPN